jgi:hypothetical protein
MIVVTEQLIGIGCLQRHARRGRMGRGSIVLSQHGITESIGELNPIQAKCRRGSVAKAKQRVIGGVASLRAGRITIQRLVIEDPHMGGAFDRPVRRGLDLARQIDIPNAVGGGLRRGIGRAIILLQQFNRHRRSRAEIIVGHAHIEMKFAHVVLVADIAVEAAHVRRRKIAESAVVQSFQGAVNGKIIDLLAPLRRTLDTSERAAHRVDLGAVIGEAVLHLHVDGPAQRIKAESGIVGHDSDRLYRRGRDQIPVDGIAERFVDAHAVLINRKSLRCAGHGRCDEAAKLHIWLKRIAGNLVDDDSRHVFLQSVRDVQRPGLLDLIGVDDIDSCRHLIGIDARARYRRGRVHKDPWQGSSDAGRILGAPAFGACRRPGHHDGWQGLNGAGCVLRISAFIAGKQAYRYQYNKQQSSAHLPHLIRSGCSGVAG